MLILVPVFWPHSQIDRPWQVFRRGARQVSVDKIIVSTDMGSARQVFIADKSFILNHGAG